MERRSNNQGSIQLNRIEKKFRADQEDMEEQMYYYLLHHQKSSQDSTKGIYRAVIDIMEVLKLHLIIKQIKIHALQSHINTRINCLIIIIINITTTTTTTTTTKTIINTKNSKKIKIARSIIQQLLITLSHRILI